MDQEKFVLYDASLEEDRLLCAELAHACLKNSRYDFVGGGSGGNYFDIDEFSAGRDSNNEYKTEIANERGKRIVESIASRIEKLKEKGVQIDRLVFIERDAGPVGMIVFKDSLGSVTQIETCALRPRKRIIASALKGRPIQPGEQVALINDVSTDGDVILQAANKIWQLGGSVSCAIVVYDRRTGARENLAQYDIDLYTIIDSNIMAKEGHIKDQPPSSTNAIHFIGSARTQ